MFLFLYINLKMQKLKFSWFDLLQTQMVKWDKTGISNVAGELSLVAGLAMWLTTFPRIRGKFFELFLYTHNLYILFIIFFILHVGISYACIMLPGFYLFSVDRYLRLLQSRQRVRVVSARILPCQSLELNLAKSPGKTSAIMIMIQILIFTIMSF
jgi:ferric-chelate reductase